MRTDTLRRNGNFRSRSAIRYFEGLILPLVVAKSGCRVAPGKLLDRFLRLA